MQGNQLPNWALYPASVAWAFQQAGFNPGGMEAAYCSDFSNEDGLGRSAAVELAFAEYWKVTGGWKIDRMRMAKICQHAESAYAGMNHGLIEQFTCAHGVARCALFFDTSSLSWQPIPIPLDTTIMIVDSSLRRNSLSIMNDLYLEECQQALAIIQKQKTNIHTLSELNNSDLIEVGQLLTSNFDLKSNTNCKKTIGSDKPAAT